MIKLYKDGKLVDFGVKSKIREYELLGYQVEFDCTPQPTFGHYQRKFDALWETLSAAEKKRLDFTVDDDELSIEEKIAYIEVAIASRRPKPKKVGFFGKVRNFFKSLIPEVNQYAYC